MEALETLLWVMVAQSLVALLWVAGARRVARPVAPEVTSRWLSAALLLPVLLAPLRVLLDLPAPLDLRVARIDAWRIAIEQASLPWGFAAVALALGTTFLFVVQELWPALAGQRRWHALATTPSPRLEAVGAEVKRRFAGNGLANVEQVPLLQLETDRPAALLQGLRAPRVLVSRGLMARLDDEALAAVIGHELAHLARGGNRALLVLWVVRALQAPSPAALVLFRRLVEVQELACDALAARRLGTPAALASALLEIERDAPKNPTALEEVQHRGAIAFTRLRVRALLDGPAEPGPSSTLRGYPTAVLLFTLLWMVA